jgi:hypothetical protein
MEKAWVLFALLALAGGNACGEDVAFSRYTKACSAAGSDIGLDAALGCINLREDASAVRADAAYVVGSACKSLHTQCSARMGGASFGDAYRALDCPVLAGAGCGVAAAAAETFDLCRGEARIAKLFHKPGSERMAVQIVWKDGTKYNLSELPAPGEQALRRWMRENNAGHLPAEDAYARIIKLAIDEHCDEYGPAPADDVPFWKYVSGWIRVKVIKWCPGEWRFNCDTKPSRNGSGIGVRG